MTTTPKQIAIASVNGLRRALNLTDNQVKAGIARYPKLPGWKQGPNFLVVPGGDQPDGAGEGAQEGGDLLRRIHLSVVIYDRSLRDMVGESEVVITKNDSILDWSEKVLGVFRYTFEADQQYSFLTGLLVEPLFYAGTSEVMPEDPDNGWYRREVYFTGLFETSLTDVSLTLPQTR